MQTIILGAGQVGTTLAELCVQENHDVTVVDSNPQTLSQLQNYLDIRTLCGNASHPNVLQEAGAHEADILIAVTNKDEINMIACQVAYTLFRTPKKIARIRSIHYLDTPELFQNDALPIDILIAPEHEISAYVQDMIRYPKAKQVLRFCNRRLLYFSVTVQPGDPLTQQAISLFSEYRLGHFYPIGVLRDDQFIALPPTDSPQVADEFMFVCHEERAQALLDTLHQPAPKARHIFIAGAGHIGFHLAERLAPNYQVKTLDHNGRAIKQVARRLDNVLALSGDASDSDVLIEENIEAMDFFCALTSSEEVNMMSALIAKTLGAKRVMALINRRAYGDLESASSIDTLLFPRPITANCLIRHIRRGDISDAKTLPFGGEILEAVVHGDQNSSRLVGRSVKTIGWPKDVYLCAIIRKTQVLFDTVEEVIKSEDHLLFFVASKEQISKVERLIQVDISFV